MSGELAGAADIITGVALARTVEPDTGEGRGNSNSCLNCGTALIGAHCHNCGQKSQVHRTLHAFGHDILHSVLHFDGKIWRTLPMLFWKPGDLTRRYVHGERAKFVSPLALFLFTVFLTFAVFSNLVPKDVDAVVGEGSAKEEYLADRKDIQDDIAKLETDKKEWIANGTPGYQWMDGEIIRLQDSLKQLDEGKGNEIRRSEIAARKIALDKGKIQTEIARLEAELQAATEAGRPLEGIQTKLEEEKMGLELTENASALVEKNGIENLDWKFTNLKGPGPEALNAMVKKAAANPQLLLYKLQSNAYKFSWALIPISVPFVWLLFFWRPRFKMFDHAVFVTYSLCFIMLLSIICALLIRFPVTEPLGGILLAFYPPIHMYRNLRYAYQTSRFGALWRTFLLSFFALMALILFAVLIVALGVT